MGVPSSRTGLNRGQDRSHAGELLVKVTGISGAADCRKHGRGSTLVVDVIPVDVAEEGVRHDFLGISGTRAKTKLRLTSKELL